MVVNYTIYSVSVKKISFILHLINYKEWSRSDSPKTEINSLTMALAIQFLLLDQQIFLEFDKSECVRVAEKGLYVSKKDSQVCQYKR